MSAPSSHMFKRYGLAVLLVATVLVLRYYTDQYTGFKSPFMLFTAMIVISGWYGGLGPALLATAMATIGGIFFFIEPVLSFDLVHSQDRLRAAMFLGVSLLISFFCGHLYRANRVLTQDSRSKDKLRERITQSEKMFRSIFNQQFQFMAILDKEGHVLEINDLALKNSGYTRGDIIGKPMWRTPFWEHLSPTRDKWRDYMQQAKNNRQNGATGLIDYRIASGDVRQASYRLRAVTEDEDSQDISFYIAEGQDVTEQHAQQMALQESEERWRLAIEGMNDGIWDYNPASGKTFFSDRTYEMLGYNRDHFGDSADSFSRFVHPEDREFLDEQMQKYLRRDIPEFKALYRILHRSGEWRWFLSRAKAHWDKHGNVKRFVGSHADMTDLQNAIEKAEAANHAKSAFLANMSHEIRTPMNAVVGIANLLHNSQLHPEKQREFIHTLQLSAKAAMDLINDVLDIAKIENSQMKLEKIEFKMDDMIQDVVKIMSVRAREKNLSLDVRNHLLPHNHFIGDPLRLRQIIMNLVGNAVKFTEKGGITIDLENSGIAKDGVLPIKIRVIDTGIGIAEDKLDAIFSNFTQADASMTRRYGGTGMGLAICKSLAELMGGSISVESALGEGSCFTILFALPIADIITAPREIIENAQPLEDSGQPKFANQNKPKVLLVEDYKGNIVVATSMLEALGYDWDLAENGEEAVKKAEKNFYDLILMDVQMPAMDGLEATRVIRQTEQQKNKHPVPILAMTAHSLAGDRERCLEAGMDDYISKPFKADMLKEKTRTLIQEYKKHAYES